MGVPLQAVKNKVKQEGLDDSVMDNPDGPAQDKGSHDGREKLNDGESSEGDESDGWEDQKKIKCRIWSYVLNCLFQRENK